MAKVNVSWSADYDLHHTTQIICVDYCLFPFCNVVSKINEAANKENDIDST